MELRQLRYFVSAVRQGSLKNAARDNFVTQPAISIQLKKLEEELGEKLFVRKGRRIVPTDAGELLMAHAEDILGRIETLIDELKGLKWHERGTLRLGNIDAASTYVLPAVFRSYRRKYPGIDIQVTVADSDTLGNALESGTIEIAIATLPFASEGFTVTPIYQDHMVLVVGPRHELARDRRKRRRPLHAVAESGLITYPARSMTQRLIEKVFIENGVNFRASMEMSSPEAIKRLTESGLGASILPRKVVADEVRRGTLRIVPTGKVRFSRTLGVVYKDEASLSPTARAFLEMLMKRYQR